MAIPTDVTAEPAVVKFTRSAPARMAGHMRYQCKAIRPSRSHEQRPVLDRVSPRGSKRRSGPSEGANLSKIANGPLVGSLFRKGAHSGRQTELPPGQPLRSKNPQNYLLTLDFTIISP